MNHLVRLGFALTLLPLAACTPDRVNPMAATIPQPVPSGSSVSAADTQFAVQVSRSNQFETAASRLALQKAGREDVRRYAERMIDHQAASTQQLERLAGNKGITLPGSLEPQQQQALANLEAAAPGASFERQYLAGQNDGHVALAGTMRSQVASGTDPELTAMAQRSLPEIERHAADAQRLAGRR